MIPKPRKLLQLAPPTRCVRECQSSDSITLHRLLRLRLQLKAFTNDWWQRFVELTFGVFMTGLILLLILLYADVPIVGP